MKHFDSLDYGFDLYIGFSDGRPRAARLTKEECERAMAIDIGFNHKVSIRKCMVFPSVPTCYEDDFFTSPESIPCPLPDDRMPPMQVDHYGLFVCDDKDLDKIPFSQVNKLSHRLRHSWVDVHNKTAREYFVRSNGDVCKVPASGIWY